VMSQDIGDTSTSERFRVSSSGSAGADVCGAGFGPAVLHDLGAAIVEHEQVLVGLDQIDGLAGQEPGDVEAG